MLNATQSKSIAGAVRYFESLVQSDYYLGEDVAAYWHGKTAQVLGLDPTKPVTKKQFEALLSGMHPATGKKLTQRLRQDRRPGTDFTFSVPKSVSLAWAINSDEQIVQILRDAVRETMEGDLEPLMHRRVRDGKNVNTTNRKQTDNLIYCDFLHKTSREVDGLADPHLHIHTFAMNLTSDEGRFYAAEFAEAMRQLPMLQASFDARLARKLEHLGYEIEKTSYMQSGKMKTGWEIKGIQRSTIEKFSRRTKQIEDVAASEGIQDATAKAELGKKTRQRKSKERPMDQLRDDWKARLTKQEKQVFEKLRLRNGNKAGGDESGRLQAAVDFALEHHLYRLSTVEEHQVVATALEYGLSLTRKAIEDRLKEKDVISRARSIDGAERRFITTHGILEAERSMIAFARDGRGTRYAIAKQDHEFKRDWLNDQQKKAVNHVLKSHDTVMGVMGGAGTGKTSLMQEAVEAIQNQNRQVFTFAPSTGAKDVLVEEGFANAQTVEHLIRNTKLQDTIKSGDVLWIDEAGLLDTRSMTEVFRIAKSTNARVVLSGDTRQHNSPRRGEAMRLLETEAGLNVVRIEEIQRQKGMYRQAVELISRNHQIVDANTQQTGLAAGFDLLDRMGKIREINLDNRHAILAEQYIACLKANKSALVISPTHAEGEAITREIRSRLIEAGAIGERQREVRKLQSLHFSDAEKAERSSYLPGMMVQFHQNTKGFKRGERFRVQTASQSGVVLMAENGSGDPRPLPSSNVDRFDVYSETSISLAVGDKIRFSLGGTAQDGKRRFSNGRIDEIRSFDRNGNLVLKSGMTIDRNFGHVDHGFVMTSHASQGKTTWVTLAAMGSESLPAINAKQFYVTASRATDDLLIFVDDKTKVRRAIQEAGRQLSATELFRETPPSVAIAHHNLQRRSFLQKVRSWWNRHMETNARRLTSTFGYRSHPSPSLSR